jgi:putative transposase
MGRPLRDQSPGYYHVTTRGNDRRAIYLNDVDRELFLGLLRRVAVTCRWRLHAWCLMPNHFHLIVEISAENLARGMHQLNGVYAHWFTERYERTGHLFERRYSAKRVEGDEQLGNTVEYVINNPVEAGLCANPFRWRWLGGPLIDAARPRV